MQLTTRFALLHHSIEFIHFNWSTNMADTLRSNGDTPDAMLKRRCLEFLIHVHQGIAKTFGISLFNVDDMADVTSIIFTFHNNRKYLETNQGMVPEVVPASAILTAGGMTAEKCTLLHFFNDCLISHGFTYNMREETSKNEIRCLSSLLVLIHGYKSRYNELSLGTWSISYRNTPATKKVISIFEFGLDYSHCGLTSGCTYSPMLQFLLQESIGPLTIAIQLCMTRDVPLQNAWKAAFIRAFKMIPCIEEVANLLAGSRTQYSTIVLLRVIADFASLGCVRYSNVAYIPMALIMASLNTTKEWQERFESAHVPSALITSMDHPAVFNLDFNGRGLCVFWNSIPVGLVTMRINNAMTSQMAGQALFHGVFGTATESLTILQWMTDVKFNIRSDFGNAFTTTGTGVELKSVVVTIIKPLYVAELCNIQTDLVPEFANLFAEDPILAERSEKNVQLEDIDDRMTPFERTITKLNAVKVKLYNHIMLQNGVIEFGTSSYFTAANVTHATWGVPISKPDDDCFRQCFYSNET